MWFELSSKAGPRTGRSNKLSGPQFPFSLLEMVESLSDSESEAPGSRLWRTGEDLGKVVAVTVVTLLSSLSIACFVWGAVCCGTCQSSSISWVKE